MAIANQDRDRLRILSYCHLGWTLIVAGFGCLLFITMAFVPHRYPPAYTDYVFTTAGGKIVIASWILAACTFLAGWLLALRKQYGFCIVFAIVNCVIVPFGTVLGIYTLVILLRPRVKTLFDGPLMPQSSL